MKRINVNRSIFIAMATFLFIGTFYTNADAQVNGRNVTEVHAGKGNKVDVIVSQVGPKKWKMLNANRSAVLANLNETGRDAWSVYLTDTAGRGRLTINLFKKTVAGVFNGRATDLGKVIKSSSTTYRKPAAKPTAAARTAPTATACSLSDWAGDWDTNFKLMSWKAQRDGSLSGTYNTAKHFIDAKLVNGNPCVVEGTWRHRNGISKGRVRFTMNPDKRSFKGAWSAATVKPTGTNWTGKKKGAVAAAVTVKSPAATPKPSNTAVNTAPRRAITRSATNVAKVDPLGPAPLTQGQMNQVMRWIALKTSAIRVPYCYRKSETRGAGKPLSNKCAPGLEKDGLLCYPKCRSGYNGVGPVCWERCKPGYRDIGAFCQKPKAYGRGVGYGWKIGESLLTTTGHGRVVKPKMAQVDARRPA